MEYFRKQANRLFQAVVYEISFVVVFCFVFFLLEPVKS